MEYCRKNKDTIKAFLVYKFDRLARNTLDHQTIRALLITYGTQVISVTEPTDDSPAGRLLETMLASIAQFSNEIRGERAKNGMMERFKKGYWSWYIPVGYRKKHIEDARGKIIEKTMEVDPLKAPMIRQAFEEFSSGLFSLRQMAERLDAKGLRSNLDKRICQQKLSHILRNKFYIGLQCSKKWGLEIQGHHEPLISEPLFYKVQSVLDGHRTNNSRQMRQNPDFPLRGGFLKCGHCGNPMTGSRSKGHSARYSYYHCYNPSCDHTAIPRADLNTAFEKLLQSIEQTDEIRQRFREKVMQEWEKRYKTLNKRNTQVQKDLDEIEAERKRIVALKVKEVFDDATYQEQIEQIKERTALKKLELHEGQTDEYSIETTMIYAERCLKDIRILWCDLNTAQKKQFQTLIFPNGLYWDYPGFRTADLAPSYLALDALARNDEPLVSRVGFEPTTNGLKVHCSTAELPAQGSASSSVIRH